MKTRICSLTIMTLIISTTVLGQAKYYKNHDGKIINSFTYLNLKTNKIQKIRGVINGVPKAIYLDEYIGKKLPSTKLLTIDNKSFIIDDLKGKPTLINFWFTTCKPCIDEIVVLNKIKRTFKDSVNFIAITFQKKDVVTKFLSKHNYSFTHVIDAQKFFNELGLTGCPVNVFIDKKGKVVSVESGIPYIDIIDGKAKMDDGENFIKLIRKLL